MLIHLLCYNCILSVHCTSCRAIATWLGKPDLFVSLIERIGPGKDASAFEES